MEIHYIKEACVFTVDHVGHNALWGLNDILHQNLCLNSEQHKAASQDSTSSVSLQQHAGG